MFDKLVSKLALIRLLRMKGQEESGGEQKSKEESGVKQRSSEAVNVAAAPSPNYELGDNYYLAYKSKSNGYGGYCSVDIRLYRGGELIRQITDERGAFLNFPGVEHGDWEKHLTSPFRAVTSFMVYCGPFMEDGLAWFSWMVQPDGRYWADDGGFGMEDDVEVTLYAKLDKNGCFVTPFGENS